MKRGVHVFGGMCVLCVGVWCVAVCEIYGRVDTLPGPGGRKK